MKAKVIHNRRGDDTVEIKVYFPAPYKNNVYISTGVRVSEGEYNQEINKVMPPSINYKLKNKVISEKLYQIQDVINTMEENNNVSPSEFRRIYNLNKIKVKGEIQDLNTFAEYAINSNNEISNATKISYKRTISILNEYGTVWFKDINNDFAISFNRYLLDKYNNSNTVKKHHIVIGKFVNIAAKKGYLTKEQLLSYSLFKPISQKVNKEILTKEDIEKLEDNDYDYYDPEFKRLFVVRDMFLFAFYTALRVSDILDLRPDNFIRTENGLILKKQIVKLRRYNRVIEINLSKHFNGAAEKIINPYLGNDPVFPQYSKMQLYHSLSTVMKDSGVNKSASFHTARHSSLTAVAMLTGNVFDVMLFGGITNISTAQKYIHISEETFGKKQINW